jgi:hypothetical protein
MFSIVPAAAANTASSSILVCYMVSPNPGCDLSNKDIFLARFSIVPGT